MTEYRYKWVRTETHSPSIPRRVDQDVSNVKRHEAEGWEKVPADQLPTHLSLPEPKKPLRWPDWNPLDPGKTNEYGGLALYRIPEEKALLRQAHYASVAKAQSTAAVDHYLRDNVYAPMKKFVETRTTPQENLHEFIAALPETLTDEDAENVQCYIEDFLLPNLNSYPEKIVQINELRRRIKRRPYTMADLIDFSERSRAAQHAYAIRREDDAKAMASLVAGPPIAGAMAEKSKDG